MEDRRFRLTGHRIRRSGTTKIETRIPWRKFLFLLFFVISIISFLVLFRTTVHSISSTPLPLMSVRHVSHKLTCHSTPYVKGEFTTKEYLLLSNLISLKASCNLLFFGVIPQFLSLVNLNTKGTTIFLEDDEAKIEQITTETRRMRVHKVVYREKASNAYELLKHGREHFGCKPEAIPILHETDCKLAVSGLPNEVHETKWDIVVVDGPRGDNREAPGRMGAIYTAAVIARRTGNETDVVVHDVDRMIEKWYSWEFLCQENLVSSKGKLWHFVVKGNSQSSGFCPEANFQIL